MPRRNFILTTGEIYHIFNRSIAKESIFSTLRHLHKLLEIVNYYRFPQSLRLSKFKVLPKELKLDYVESSKSKTPLVEIYAFAIMPNHYHFLLKQNQDKGIVTFISNFQNSYAKFYNLKHDRSGSLFQKPFKGKRIEDDEQFIHVSRYIHLNPITSYLLEFKNLIDSPWTSYSHYGSSDLESFIDKQVLMVYFKSFESYSNFLADQEGYQKTLALIKDHLLD